MLLPAAACRCLPLPSTAFHCLPLPSTAYHCLPLPATAYPCLPLPSTAFHCLPLSGSEPDLLVEARRDEDGGASDACAETQKSRDETRVWIGHAPPAAGRCQPEPVPDAKCLQSVRARPDDARTVTLLKPPFATALPPLQEASSFSDWLRCTSPSRMRVPRRRSASSSTSRMRLPARPSATRPAGSG
jgi:hypothetical protein